jgi:hypothetical protein
MNNMLAQYRNPDGSFRNIPGVGGLYNSDAAAGIVSAMPGGGKGEAFDNKGVVASVRNAILKARSGGAVTPSEADRMLQELEMSVYAGQDQFINASKGITSRLNSKLKIVMGGYQDILPDYKERGGNVHTLLPNIDQLAPPPPPKNPNGAVAAPAKVADIDAQIAELEAQLKASGVQVY